MSDQSGGQKTGDTYNYKGGSFFVGRTTTGWFWRTSEGKKGTAKSKKKAKKKAKKSLDECFPDDVGEDILK